MSEEFSEVDQDPIRMFRRIILRWADREGLRTFPWRDAESPFHLLVAEILLQRTFAAKVEPIYEHLFNRYTGPEELSSANPEALTELLEPLGLQTKKARALIANAEYVKVHGVPTTEDELRELRSVGRYAANAVRCFGFGERVPLVDSNFVRVYNRAFGLDLEGPLDERAWEFAERVLPDEGYQRFNLVVLDFAAEVCAPRSPKCGACPYSNDCAFFQEGQS